MRWNEFYGRYEYETQFHSKWGSCYYDAGYKSLRGAKVSLSRYLNRKTEWVEEAGE